MRVTGKGQATIPQNVRESMGILPAETEIEFDQDESGRRYIAKVKLLSGFVASIRPAS